MKSKRLLPVLAVTLCAGIAMAQDRAQSRQTLPDHPPPPQAYADCKGKKAGDAVQHTTREGKVAATCAASPEGLVARPNQPKGGLPDDRRHQLPAGK